MLPRRLLVLGAFAPLGRVLAPRLARHLDHDVLATDRTLPIDAFLPGVSLAPLDPARADDLRRMLLDVSPHTVVFLSRWHDAAHCLAAPGACNAALADTVDVVARACLATGARLVVHSSDLVFPGELGRLYRETDRPAPSTVAGKHHLAMENAARGAGLDRWAVVRTGPLYDPHHPDALHVPLEGSPLAHLARPYTTFDLAAAGIERVVRRQATGVYHVAGRSVHTPSSRAFAHGLSSDEGPAPAAATALLTLRAETELGISGREAPTQP